jgi:hypothetical protein
MKKKKYNNENRFNIDFFEFTFLVEACIPPRPIARSLFWDSVCNHYYHVLTTEERSNLLEWIQRNPNFDLKNEDCKLFYDRYNSDNQYLITTDYNNEVKDVYCFMHNGRYHIASNTSIDDVYITNVKKQIL